jgi:hypothetical protein
MPATGMHAANPIPSLSSLAMIKLAKGKTGTPRNL